MCCSHSFNIWKLGRAAGSRFQHCFMMLYTTSGQPSGQSILYPFSTRGTTSFNGYRNEKTKLLGKEHHLFCSGLLLHEGQFDARNVHGKLLGIYSTYSSSNKDLLLFIYFLTTATVWTVNSLQIKLSLKSKNLIRCWYLYLQFSDKALGQKSKSPKAKSRSSKHLIWWKISMDY